MGITDRLWPGLHRDIVLNSLVASPLVPKPLRWRALRALGMAIGPCSISPKVWFGSTSRMSIGAGTTINYGCMFNTTSPVSVGERCDIGMRVTFVTSSHESGTPTRRAGALTSAPISVGDGTWIGAGVTILSGVTIGSGCVVAAGAVVTRDCAPDGLYAGVPAKRMKDLPAGDDDRHARATRSTSAGVESVR